MTALSFPQPPHSICILRLSAIGDITHVLPIIATLQAQWPQTRITWIIGKAEYQLVKSIQNIEFIVFNKNNGIREFLQLRKRLAGREFDLLLMMQVALRASLASMLIKAPLKVGYDRARSRDFQHLFCNRLIEGPARVHVLDTFFQFLQTIGIAERNMNWLLQVPPDDAEFALDIIGSKRCVVINPCSSSRKNNWRNWAQERYTEIIDHLHSLDVLVVLTGGPDRLEIAMAEEISETCKTAPLNLVGKTTLTQLFAVIDRAVCVIAPDTGPAHIGTVAGTPVIGLFASSNPERTGPYASLDWTINAYPQALKKFSNKTVEEASWGERIRHPQVMDLVTVDAVKKNLAMLL